jgi:hypothetical protein
MEWSWTHIEQDTKIVINDLRARRSHTEDSRAEIAKAWIAQFPASRNHGV